MPKLTLDTVTMDGFRGLRNLKLENLGWMNILVGENNSGKTSVLEALSILCNPREPLEWLAMVRRRDFGGLDETRIQSLRWCFRQSGELTDPDAMLSAACRMTCSGTFPLLALSALYQDILGEPTQEELRRAIRPPGVGRNTLSLDTSEQPGAIVTHHVTHTFPIQGQIFQAAPPSSPSEIHDIRIWEKTASSFVRSLSSSKGLKIKNATLTPYSYQLNQNQVRALSRQVFATNSAMNLQLVRDFDPDIEAVEVASFRGERPAIYLKHKRLGPAPLSVFGDALRRALLLANTLQTLQNGGLLLIDEIETGIHVSALGRVFSWLMKWALKLKVQIIATTHSLEALDAIALSTTESPGNLVTYHLEQTEQETKARRIEGELLLRLRRERGLDVR